MIIRKQNDSFIMIEQHHHAHISKEIITHWKGHFLNNDSMVNSVLYAIQMHDYGWDFFDKQPFWNDKINEPYSFINFPIIPKTVLYTEGVNKVEQKDPYAAALCSAHYIDFMKNDETDDVLLYLNHERNRIKRILKQYPHIKSEVFWQHLALLKFADNISLYVCLNEPGTSPDNQHYFFKNGIPISIQTIKSNLIDAKWISKDTIVLTGLPQVPSFSVSLKQKRLPKQDIFKKGLVDLYQTTSYEHLNLNFITHKN